MELAVSLLGQGSLHALALLAVVCHSEFLDALGSLLDLLGGRLGLVAGGLGVIRVGGHVVVALLLGVGRGQVADLDGLTLLLGYGSLLAGLGCGLAVGARLFGLGLGIIRVGLLLGFLLRVILVTSAVVLLGIGAPHADFVAISVEGAQVAGEVLAT